MPVGAALSNIPTGDTIFGEVVSGYETVEKIENVQKGPGDKPIEDQVILKATIK